MDYIIIIQGGDPVIYSIRIAVCEDNPKDMDLIVTHINSSGFSVELDTFSSGEELLESFFIKKYDLIFMDIYMERMKGIEVAARIRSIDSDVIIAFTTISLDYTLQSYRLGALKYLEKPLSPIMVQDTLELALIKHKSTSYITLVIQGRNQEINLDHIIYLEQKNQIVAINAINGTIYTSQAIKLSKIEPMLPNNFIRCHYSYIANLSYVSGLDKQLKVFNMVNGENIYIRKQDIKKASEAYENYLFNITRGDNK